MINVVNSSGTLATEKMPIYIDSWTDSSRGTDNSRLYVVTKKTNNVEDIVFPGRVSQYAQYTPRYAWTFTSKMTTANIPMYFPASKQIDGMSTETLDSYNGFHAIPYQPLSEVWKNPNRYSSAASQILSIDDTPWHYSTLGWSVSQMLGIHLNLKAAMDCLNMAVGDTIYVHFSFIATYSHTGTNSKFYYADDGVGLLIDGSASHPGTGGGFYNVIPLQYSSEAPVYDYGRHISQSNFGIIKCNSQNVYQYTKDSTLSSLLINLTPVFTKPRASSYDSDLPTQFCCCVQLSVG